MSHTGPPESRAKSAEEIAQWLRAHIAGVLKIAAADIDIDAPVDRLGLDSATAVGVTLNLEDWLERSIEPAIFYEYASIQELATALAGGAATSADEQQPLE